MYRTMRRILITCAACLLLVSFSHITPAVGDGIRWHLSTRMIVQEGKQQSAGHLREINPDLFAVLSFDSGLLVSPVMSCDLRDQKYISRDVYGNESTVGTPFTPNGPDDQVITVFGHLVYFDDSAAFSPLQDLLDPEAFRRNRFLELIYPDRTDHYELFAVIVQNADDADGFSIIPGRVGESWLNTVRQHMIIEKTLRPEDRYIILQTCRRNHPDEHILFIGVLTEPRSLSS